MKKAALEVVRFERHDTWFATRFTVAGEGSQRKVLELCRRTIGTVVRSGVQHDWKRAACTEVRRMRRRGLVREIVVPRKASAKWPAGAA